MTLEQYRAMASQKAYMRGTTHAVAARVTPRDDKETDPKASHKRNTQWACTSYKCGADGAAVMNAKFADRCSACGAIATRRGRGGVQAHHDGRAVPREPKQTEGEVEYACGEWGKRDDCRSFTVLYVSHSCNRRAI